jgi:hypothetical protein
LRYSSETWQLYLIREFYKREPETNNPFYQSNYWPFPMSKTKLIYDSVEPISKDGQEEEVVRDDTDTDSPLSDNEAESRDSKDPEGVKQESRIKTEEQTPEIEAPLEEQPDPINFFDLDLDTKVRVLYILCEVCNTCLDIV